MQWEHLSQSFRQDAPAKIATLHVTPYLARVIKAIDPKQGGPIGGFAEPTDGPEPVEGQASDLSPSDIPLLTLEEKRRILARIARVNPLDCFDETGAFDIVRAKRVLPPGAVRHIAVHETTRLNAEGQPTTQRRISVRLVDPVSALRLDDLLERQREPRASHSNSSSSSSTKNFSRRDFNLLTEKTMALDDANHSIELLKKAIAEMDDRELQLSKELDEKHRQLSQTLSKVEGEAAQRSSMAPQSRDQSAQRDTGCQPEVLQSQNSSSPSLSSAEGDTLIDAEKSARKRKPIEVRILELEIEHRRNTSGIGGFNAWLRSKGLDPANYPPPPFVPNPPAPKLQKTANPKPAGPTARPPP